MIKIDEGHMKWRHGKTRHAVTLVPSITLNHTRHHVCTEDTHCHEQWGCVRPCVPTRFVKCTWHQECEICVFEGRYIKSKCPMIGKSLVMYYCSKGQNVTIYRQNWFCVYISLWTRWLFLFCAHVSTCLCQFRIFSLLEPYDNDMKNENDVSCVHWIACKPLNWNYI